MIQSRYDPSLGIMSHHASGTITTSDILDAISRWFAHAEFDPQCPVVWLLSDAFLDMTIEELRQMYDLVRGVVENKRSGGKTAWVHDSALVRMMIQAVGGEFDWGSQWGTFTSADEAYAWCQSAS